MKISKIAGHSGDVIILKCSHCYSIITVPDKIAEDFYEQNPNLNLILFIDSRIRCCNTPDCLVEQITEVIGW